jgi:hypothetical protein
MKLLVHASIFSVVFAGFVASALTSKPTARIHANSLVISSAMPVPSCDPNTGCVNSLTVSAAMPVPSCDPNTGCAN